VKTPLSIRARLIWGAFAVLLVFLAGAGWAVQQAYLDSLRAQRFARLQTTIYLLMAGAELNTQGALVMPAALAEPRLSLPASGLYANIANPDQGEKWRSSSSLGIILPFQRDHLGSCQGETGRCTFERRNVNSHPDNRLAVTDDKCRFLANGW